MTLDFSQRAPRVAEDLIGWSLLMRGNEGVSGGVISEAEAYTRDDPASHSYKGATVRNKAMFGPPGSIYIYRIYGIHHCLNIVCGNSDGQAVLIRSLIPTTGLETMVKNRGRTSIDQLTNGPAKIVQALGIPPDLNGVMLQDSAIELYPPTTQPVVRRTPRIGISKATETLWRFTLE